MIREAARQIVRSKAVEKIWVGQLLKSFKTAKRALTISADFTGVTAKSMGEVAVLLVEIEKRVAELSVQAGKRIEEIELEEARSGKAGL
jgi:hypothetical protein